MSDTTVEKKTFCRVCEPACGLVASVEGDSLVKLRADQDHPVSKGFVCNKGIYGLDIHNDPDRLRVPLRRTPGGDFEEVSWDVALTEIADRLQSIRERNGSTAIAGYAGNPGAFNTLLGPSYGNFMLQTGARKFFSSGTQDCANKFAGSHAVFGTRTLHPVPDIEHSDFVLLIGENPSVSHMSFVSIPHPMKHLKNAEDRGATVLYVNPRTIESASAAGDVLHIKPDTDVYLLAALIHEIDITTGFHVQTQQRGNHVAKLRSFAAHYPADRVASITGIAADSIRALARDFVAAPSACVHMSTGVNMGRQGTLAYWLVHMLALVTGNLGERGGNFYSLGFYERAAASGRGAAGEVVESPVGGLMREPGAGIALPGNLMADYIANPADPVKALFVSSGNPVLSIGGEAKMRAALEGLELLVCVDIYRNATGEYADYVLPAAGAFEREDINIVGLGMQYQPSVQFTEAVVPPAYERKPDWWIWEQLASRMGGRSAFDESDEPNMWSRVDAMLRSRNHSLADLRRDQVIALERSDPDELFSRVQHDDELIDCCPPVFAEAIERMGAIFTELDAEPADQLKLISKRDNYTFNSWYANVDKLKARGRDENYLYMHPEDAQLRQIADGERVRVSNTHGAIETPVKLSDTLMRGVVAMTHGGGQGKTSGMQTAQARPGANCNALLPSGPDSFEPLSNQAHMTGVAVEVARA